MSFFSFLVLYAPEGDLYFPFRENIFSTKDIVEHKNEKKSIILKFDLPSLSQKRKRERLYEGWKKNQTFPSLLILSPNVPFFTYLSTFSLSFCLCLFYVFTWLLIFLPTFSLIVCSRGNLCLFLTNVLHSLYICPIELWYHLTRMLNEITVIYSKFVSIFLSSPLHCLSLPEAH